MIITETWNVQPHRTPGDSVEFIFSRLNFEMRSHRPKMNLFQLNSEAAERPVRFVCQQREFVHNIITMCFSWQLFRSEWWVCILQLCKCVIKKIADAHLYFSQATFTVKVSPNNSPNKKQTSFLEFGFNKKLQKSEKENARLWWSDDHSRMKWKRCLATAPHDAGFRIDFVIL